MKSVSYLLLPKERKTQKKTNSKTKKARKVSKQMKKKIFLVGTFVFSNIFFSSNEILLFNNLTLKDQQKQTKTLKI